MAYTCAKRGMRLRICEPQDMTTKRALGLGPKLGRASEKRTATAIASLHRPREVDAKHKRPLSRRSMICGGNKNMATWTRARQGSVGTMSRCNTRNVKVKHVDGVCTKHPACGNAATCIITKPGAQRKHQPMARHAMERTDSDRTHCQEAFALARDARAELSTGCHLRRHAHREATLQPPGSQPVYSALTHLTDAIQQAVTRDLDVVKGQR